MAQNEFGDIIPTANFQIDVIKAKGYKSWLQKIIIERHPHLVLRTKQGGLILDLRETRGEVYAEVIGGNWAVKCPFVGCFGAIVVEPDEPYFCPDCLNLENDHKPCHVVFPQERDAIEQLLLVRPKPNRNWQVGESLSNLKFENAAYLAKVGKK